MTSKKSVLQIARYTFLLSLVVFAYFTQAAAQTVTVQYVTSQDWGSGFQGEIKITNTGTQAINGWTLAFDFDRSISSISSASITSHVGNRYTVQNAGFNATIAAGGNVTFSFVGSPGNVTSPPANFILNNAAINGTTPTTFSYQGKLSDGSSAANGVYDFQFVLYDESGTQVGQIQAKEDVTVAAGIFNVMLDFGTNAFTGANRFLEIRVRQGNSTGAFTALTPRQPIAASPHAIRSLNATSADKLGNVDAASFVQTNDARLTDSRTPTAGSSNYIQNTSSVQSGSANFNIGGNGTVNSFDIKSGGGGLNLNKTMLRLTAGNDSNHGMLYSGAVDGPEFRAFGGFRWTNGLNGATERMVLSATGNLTVTGTITATSFNGNATSATTAANFSGSLAGDIIGTQNATVIKSNAVTAAKIASNQVVKDINGLKDSVTIAGGSGITVTPSGNTLTLALTNTPLRKFAVIVNATSGSQFNVQHNLGAIDVQVMVYRQDSQGWNQINVDSHIGNGEGYVIVADENLVKIGIYAAGTYRIVIIS